jgi:hypothetical protein
MIFRDGPHGWSKITPDHAVALEVDVKAAGHLIGGKINLFGGGKVRG